VPSMPVRPRLIAAGVLAVAAVAALTTACTGGGAGTAPSALPVSSVASAVAPRPPATSPPAAASLAIASETPVQPPNPCAGNGADQLVRVSLRSQHLWLCHGVRLDFQTPITSGASALSYDSTPTGNFQIQGRDRNTILTLNTGKQYTVKYWIPFSSPLFGFHDASWQTIPYGSQKYRTQGSHGCVHMPLKAIEYFYNWVKLGATVHIRA
jgi:hypothetical protein